MNKVKRSVLLILILTLAFMTLVFTNDIEALEDFSYEADNLIALNNQSGVHYSNFDGVSFQIIDHTNTSQFCGMTLTDLKVSDFSSYNAMIIQFENASNADTDLRFAYNHAFGSSNYGQRINQNNADIYSISDDGSLEFLTPCLNSGTSVTTTYYKVETTFCGYLVVPMNENLKNISSLTFYGNQTNMRWCKFNVGNVYVGNVNFPEAGSKNGGNVIDQKLVWAINFDKPNYSKDFYDWVTNDTSDCDAAFAIKAVKSHEFYVTDSWRVTSEDYGYNKNSMFSILYPDELKDKHGKVNLKDLKGLLLDVNNTGDKAFNFHTMFTRFRTEWISKEDASAYYMPKDGYNFWGSANSIPKEFDGKIFIPYSNQVYMSHSLEGDDAKVPEFTYDQYAQLIIKVLGNEGSRLQINSISFVSKDLVESNVLEDTLTTIYSKNSYQINKKINNIDINNNLVSDASSGLLMNVSDHSTKASKINLKAYDSYGEVINYGDFEISAGYNGNLYIPFDYVKEYSGNGRLDGFLKRITISSEETLSITLKGLALVYGDKTESNSASDLTESIKYSITCTSTAGGLVELSSNEVFEGESVSISITPNDGYKVKELRVNNRQIKIKGSTYLVEDIEKNVDIKVTFVELDVNKANGCNGSVGESLVWILLTISAFSIILYKKKFDF